MTHRDEIDGGKVSTDIGNPSIDSQAARRSNMI